MRSNQVLFIRFFKRYFPSFIFELNFVFSARLCNNIDIKIYVEELKLLLKGVEARHSIFSFSFSLEFILLQYYPLSI